MELHVHPSHSQSNTYKQDMTNLAWRLSAYPEQASAGEVFHMLKLTWKLQQFPIDQTHLTHLFTECCCCRGAKSGTTRRNSLHRTPPPRGEYVLGYV
jgi:hypothetical protein